MFRFRSLLALPNKSTKYAAHMWSARICSNILVFLLHGMRNVWFQPMASDPIRTHSGNLWATGVKSCVDCICVPELCLFNGYKHDTHLGYQKQHQRINFMNTEQLENKCVNLLKKHKTIGSYEAEQSTQTSSAGHNDEEEIDLLRYKRYRLEERAKFSLRWISWHIFSALVFEANSFSVRRYPIHKTLTEEFFFSFWSVWTWKNFSFPSERRNYGCMNAASTTFIEKSHWFWQRSILHSSFIWVRKYFKYFSN